MDLIIIFHTLHSLLCSCQSVGGASELAWGATAFFFFHAQRSTAVGLDGLSISWQLSSLCVSSHVWAMLHGPGGHLLIFILSLRENLLWISSADKEEVSFFLFKKNGKREKILSSVRRSGRDAGGWSGRESRWVSECRVCLCACAATARSDQGRKQTLRS